jgi:hypothetical protein
MIEGYPNTLYRLRGSTPKHIAAEIDNLNSKNLSFVSPIFSQNDVFEGRPVIVPAKDWEIKKFRDDLKRKIGKNALPAGMTFQELPKANQQINQFNAGSSGYRKFILNKLWNPKDIRENSLRTEREITSSISLACFLSKSPSQLMWAHYADSHKGICFKLKLCETHLSTAHKKRLFEVKYSDKRPQISQIELFEISANGNLKEKFTTGFDLQAYLIKMLTTKSTEWSYENEWRWLDYGRNADPDYADTTPMVLSEIICGAKASEQTKKLCLEGVQNRLPVKQNVPSKTGYGFTMKDLN